MDCYKDDREILISIDDQMAECSNFEAGGINCVAINECEEERYIPTEQQVEKVAEYDEILLRLERTIHNNTSKVNWLRWAIARVCDDKECDKDVCEDITMSQTLNRLIEELDKNNKMLDKILEKTRQSIGNLKLFTD